MKPGTEIASYSPTKVALADLASKYKGVVYDVTTPKGMTEAKAAKKELAEHRITLEKARVNWAAPIVELLQRRQQARRRQWRLSQQRHRGKLPPLTDAQRREIRLRNLCGRGA